MEKYKNEALTAQERAEDLVSRLTVMEAASQLKYDAPSVEAVGISSYNWWNEGLHGIARAGIGTMFPQAIGLAAMFDDELLRKAADVISDEARAKYNEFSARGDLDIYKGLTLWSPNINIFRDPRWGRGQETYGEDPYLTARLGIAFTKGLQGDGSVMKTAACAKHFAVHSGPEGCRHGFDSVVSEKDLTETYLSAFEALVKEANVESIMGAYNRVNGEPSCASPKLMARLKGWGFDGYFVSDCWAIRDFHLNHRITKTAPESAAMALKAGCHLNCGNTYIQLLIALRDGLITEEDIRNACTKLMRTRVRLGMFDKETEYDCLNNKIVACDEHKQLSLECARRSMVLLKNNGILPLDKSKIRTIGVIGPNADSRTALEGNYNGTADRYITFLEGIQDEFDGRVMYAEGCHLYKDRIMHHAMANDRITEAEIVADYSDVVILCVGLDSTIEGEEGDAGNEFSSGDKNNLYLPESQRRLIRAVMKRGKPVIIVTAAGSSINVEADCDAEIHVWYSGQSGGKALADILFGKISPSGKLPVTFYKNADELPDFEDYSMKNRTYRYVESNDNVLYPFGYGLTYSKVKCTELKYADGIAEITLINSGDYDTEEVIQLYIKGYSENAVLNHSLCGFKRVFLEKGETRAFTLEIDKNAFKTVNREGERVCEGNRFTLYGGISQPDSLSERLTDTQCLSVDITVG